MSQTLMNFDRPLARACDSSTSKAAAAETMPRLRELHRRLLAVAAELVGDFTASEVADVAHERFPSASSETYRKRAREIERAGLIREHAVRQCRQTGKQARTFVLNRQ